MDKKYEWIPLTTFLHFGNQSGFSSTTISTGIFLSSSSVSVARRQSSLIVKLALERDFHLPSLTLPSLRRIIFYINEEITFCHCAKGDFITVKGRHDGIYFYN